VTDAKGYNEVIPPVTDPEGCYVALVQVNFSISSQRLSKIQVECRVYDWLATQQLLPPRPDRMACLNPISHVAVRIQLGPELIFSSFWYLASCSPYTAFKIMQKQETCYHCFCSLSSGTRTRQLSSSVLIVLMGITELHAYVV
jgi:hypothetical protein